MAFFMNTFKYTIFLVNLIFFGLGIFLAYEAYKQLDNDIFNLDGALKSPIYFTFVISIIVVLISFLGCCGTSQESPCMIRTYASLILICVILQVVAVVLIVRTDPDQISKTLKTNVIAKFGEQSPSVQKSIQLFQQEHSCCGIDSYNDYNTTTANIPNSCCQKYKEGGNDKDTMGGCAMAELEKSIGCKAKFSEYVQGNYKNVYIVVGCIFGFQLLVVILSFALSKNIKEQYNVV